MCGRFTVTTKDTKTIADALGTTPTNVYYLLHVCQIRTQQIYSDLKAGAVTPEHPAGTVVH